MNNSNCGACGTPKSTNRFKENDCPKCNSENFVGLSPVVKMVTPFKKTKVETILVEEEIEDLVEV